MPLSTPEIAPLLGDYFSNKISLNHQERIEDAAEQLTANGTPAFRQGIALQVAGVPVAAHHTRFIERTLSGLALQAEHAPTLPTVVMSLNRPKYDWESRAQVAENADIVRHFQSRYPHLPVSFFETDYEDDVPIGDVRDGIFGAAAILHERRARTERRLLTDLIFTNWDVDTLDATPDYFARIQHSYRQHDRPIWTAYPNTQHARINPAELPDANRLVAWYDLGVRAGAAALPAHYSINLFSWLVGKGYMHENYGEHAVLKRRLQRSYGETVPTFHLATSVARVSPHRFMGKMAAGEPVGYGGLSVPAKAVEAQPLQTDISPNYFNTQLESLLAQVVSAAYLRRDNALRKIPGMSVEEADSRATEYVRRYLRVAAAIIGNVHDTGRLMEARLK